MATDAHTVVTKLIAIIETGFGDDISAANKSRLELAGTVLSGLINEAEPALAAKFDLDSLLDAISEGEDAIVSGEESAKKLIAIFGKKEEAKAETPATPTATATETHEDTTAPAAESTEAHTDTTTTTTHAF